MNRINVLTVKFKNGISTEEIKYFRGAIIGAVGSENAILFHNRRDVPDGLDERTLKLSHIVRDADKPMPEPLYVPKPKREFKVYKSLEGFKQASWIWYPDTNSLSGAKAFFRQEFDLGDKVPGKAELSVAADDMFRCRINGETR